MIIWNEREKERERFFVLSHANLKFLLSIIKDSKEHISIMYDIFSGFMLIAMLSTMKRIVSERIFGFL